MITFFATARPFRGHIGMIQTNAIRSWLALCPPCEVLLLGDDEGMADIARQFGLRHFPEIECNEYGTPLISSLFQVAEEKAKHEVLCQINADIMITDDFFPAVEKVCSLKKNFLIAGQRWDVEMERAWDFEQPNWQGRLREYVRKNGNLHPPTGLDYFVFPKGLWGRIPPFAIGRRVLDNWLVYRARALRVPVIDATEVITVAHQNHDYAHVKHATDDTTEGPEAVNNRELAGGWGHIFTIQDATHLLAEENPASRSGSFVLRRKWGILPVPVLKTCKKLSYLSGAGLRVLKRHLHS